MAPMTKQAPRPALTTFVGRQELLDQIEVVVRTHRLVTLVGPGGIGKTRLSLELGKRVAESFEDGVAFVALDSGLVEQRLGLGTVSDRLKMPEGVRDELDRRCLAAQLLRGFGLKNERHRVEQHRRCSCELAVRLPI